MSVPTVAFFNNKGGVGKTSSVYHLAWMYTELDKRVVAADLDPQANLTAAFLTDERVEALWADEAVSHTIFGSIEPLIKATGDIAPPRLAYGRDNPLEIDDPLALLAGDLALSRFEDQLSEVWPKCMDGDERAFRVMSAFWRVMQQAAEQHEADLILIDLGPNLGAINRATLIAADYVVIPLAPDLFSIQGLKNLGPTLKAWRTQWADRLARNPAPALPLPQGRMATIGYIVLQHTERLNRPVRAYQRWMTRIPQVYASFVLDETVPAVERIADDPHHLASLKHYASLMPMAQEAHKPIFHLRAADGAIGAHSKLVQTAYQDFKQLAQTIIDRIGLDNAAGN